MPQLQQVVLTDREATPVAHTFTPTRMAGGVAVLHERTGTPIADPQLSLSIRETPENFKVLFKLDVPSVQTETVNGVDRPVIVHTSYAKAEFAFPKTTTEQERDNIVGMFSGLLAESNALPDGVVINLEGIF